MNLFQSFFFAKRDTATEPGNPDSIDSRVIKLQGIAKKYGFQNENQLVHDGKLIIQWLDPEKIDVFTLNEENDKIAIRGFYPVLKNNRKYKLLIEVILEYSYPNVLPTFQIENLSLKERDIKINRFYRNCLGEQIVLNSLILKLATWFEHYDMNSVLDCLGGVLSKNFPYIKVKTETKIHFHQTSSAGTPKEATVPNNLEVEQEEKEKQRQVEQNEQVQDDFEIISPIRLQGEGRIAPLMPTNGTIIGPLGIEVGLQIQLQKLLAQELGSRVQELRNELATQRKLNAQLVKKQYEINSYKQQLSWNRVKLSDITDVQTECDQHSTRFLKRFESLKRTDIQSLVETEEFSEALLNLCADICAIEDAMRFVIHKFRAPKQYDKVYRATQKLAEQQFYNRLLLRKYISNNE